MTNSLRKDSHITPGLCVPKFTVPYYNSTGARIRKQYNSAPENNSIGTSVNKPAEINFCGLSSRTLAYDSEFKTLVEAAQKIVGSGKKQRKDVMKFMKDAAGFLIPEIKKASTEAKPSKEPSQAIKSFIEANKTLLQKKIDTATELTKEDNFVMIKDQNNSKSDIKVPKMVPDPNDKSKQIKELRANPEELRDEIIKSIEDATDGIYILDKNPWYKDNPYLDYFLSLAEENNVAFSATFALLLTCILRPAAIVALPGDKKNNDDKKYAAAHSIASGVIGFVVATAVSSPISAALKKVLAEPSMYIKAKDKKYYNNDDVLYEKAKKAAVKRADYLECSMKMSKTANTWITRSVDVLMAIPKACITIALIPPILKYIFGYEKKKHVSKPINNIQINHNQNQLSEKKPKNIEGGIK